MRWLVPVQVRGIDLEVRIIGDHMLVPAIRAYAMSAADALHQP
ncbi:hypothetical protein [Cupriavidus taiwanensis]|nr:hypothetical protein [Cupriavidus taiwanensis]